MKTLLVVDMQRDFMPGGALAVPRGDEIIPIINKLSASFPLVLASKDWHPLDHVSFAASHPGKKIGDIIDVQGSSQVLWPVHCVQNTPGAEFDQELNTKNFSSIFYKGTDKWIDSYSAFFDNAKKKSTGLAEYLKNKNVREIYLVGVATEYCVLYSAFDAIELGLDTYVVIDACRAINLQEQDEQRALTAMSVLGVKIISSSNL